MYKSLVSFSLILILGFVSSAQTLQKRFSVSEEKSSDNISALFSEPFTESTLSDPTNWSLSKGSSSDAPCLTGRSLSDGPISLSGGSEISGCSNSPDAPSFGALRLTNNGGGQSGSMIYVAPLSTAGGLDIQFKLAEYGGSGADGISFFLKDGSNTIDTPGAPGGALGYANGPSVPGVPGGIFGIGFDLYGNFGGGYSSIAIRGSDTSVAKDGSSGYDIIGTTASSAVSYAGSDRISATRLVRISVDPANVASPKIRVFFSDNTGTLPSTPTLEVAAPQAYLDASTFKFGFSASTGGSTNFHEVWDLGITPAVPDVEMTNKCIGGGWYGGKKTDRSNFQFTVQLTEEDEVVGQVVWMFRDSSRGVKEYRFKGTLTECVEANGLNRMTGSGRFFERIGNNWFSRGTQDVVIDFSPTVPNRRKFIPGSVSFSFPNISVGSSGNLQGGVVKVFVTEPIIEGSN